MPPTDGAWVSFCRILLDAGTDFWLPRLPVLGGGDPCGCNSFQETDLFIAPVAAFSLSLDLSTLMLACCQKRTIQTLRTLGTALQAHVTENKGSPLQDPRCKSCAGRQMGPPATAGHLYCLASRKQPCCLEDFCMGLWAASNCGREVLWSGVEAEQRSSGGAEVHSELAA